VSTHESSDLDELRPVPTPFPSPAIMRFLLPKEELRYLDRLHPIVLVVPTMIALGICLVTGIMVTAIGAGPVVGLYVWIVVGALLWLLYRVWRWSRTLLMVTDRRVVEVQSMLISRAVVKPVFRQSVVFRQDPLGARLNYGTILTNTPNGDRVNTFKWIHNPRVFYRAVLDKAV
jgi:hypothetical protein